MDFVVIFYVLMRLLKVYIEADFALATLLSFIIDSIKIE